MEDDTIQAVAGDAELAAFLARARKDAAPLCVELSKAVTPREAEFLELGATLQRVAGRVEEIVEQTEFLTGLTSRDALDSFGVELTQELDRMQALLLLAAGAENEAALMSIRTTLAQLGEQLGSFKRIVKHLHMLGISTRIESARLGADGRGFGTLADDVEKLSVAIGKQSDSISRQSQALDTLAATAMDQARHMLDSQRRCSEEMGSQVQANLEVLLQLSLMSQDLSQALGEQIREAHTHIGQAVSSLQFHDITRQQVEHVEQAMTDLLHVIDEHLIPGRSLEESDQELLAFMAEVCAMEARQVRAASDRFVDAVQSFGDRLRGVATAMGGLAEEVAVVRRDVRLTGAQTQSTALQSIEDSITSIMQSMRDFVAQGVAKGEVMDRVAGTIQEMAAFLEGVEEVGASIELIALNASVKAAHTGDKGKAMGVLAQSIQSLSHAARLQTEAIAKALSGVAASSEVLRTNSTRFREEVHVEEALSRLTVLVKGLTSIDTETSVLFAEISAASKLVARDIVALVDGLTMHREVARQLTASAAVLESLGRQAGSLAPGGHAGRHSARLESMLGRYTMEIERQIHLGVAPAGSSAAAAAGGGDPFDGVELF
ncbi:methyl-accepting chemotaxis domain-containing protein [Megalodesulfovibrio gigas]|uniref:Putative chemotaxis sensory transducer n=1 Tax=Megalodesulfovibrio gigas (strain ATCC 19364 / DSM 1382 / NCIMB 9332 / VKM B-1759) TaxID=1121448 RepID=T2GG48_MEGG1|nr:chemotaxis sensory transducer [Megalodesulfovibrio gigas]AGW15146.1 putative chemotaxis sensory transducer [Megalodesulfovibrio gigas DSM 1382 = ATCC 19364]